MKKQIRVYDIKWFYNYEDHMDDQTKEEYDKTFNAEPTEMIVDVGLTAGLAPMLKIIEASE
jgi:hypothetical protein